MTSMVFGDGILAAQIQVQALNLMFHDREIFEYWTDLPVKLDDFSSPTYQLTYELLENYYAYYKDVKDVNQTTFESMAAYALQTNQDIQTELTPEEYPALTDTFEQVFRKIDLDPATSKQQFFTHIRNTRIKRVNSKYHDALNLGLPADEYAKEIAKINEMELPDVAISDKFSIGIANAFDSVIVSPEEFLRIPTGINVIDNAIIGGLSAKDHEIGLGVALTGVGKTNMLLNFTIGAILADYYVLFITLELSKHQITRRLMAMLAHINARTVAQPLETAWKKEEVERFKLLTKSKVSNHVTVCELTDADYSPRDIENVIKTWKKAHKKQHGNSDKCLLVCVDWLDQLVPDDRKKNADEWSSLTKTCKDLKKVAAKQAVAMWTVTQANRGASGTKKIAMHHVASAFGKLYYAAVVLGLSSEAEEQQAADGVDPSLKKPDDPEFDCDKELTLSIIKNREGPKYTLPLYQGKTLRMWTQKSDYDAVEQLIKKGQLQDVFGNLI